MSKFNYTYTYENPQTGQVQDKLQGLGLQREGGSLQHNKKSRCSVIRSLSSPADSL